MERYEEQLKRVRRHYSRFRQLNDGIEMTTGDTEALMDGVYNFFLHCYHLKDWLINDAAYTAHSKQDIENHVTHTRALAICADICNGSKHLHLRNKRSGHVPTTETRKVTIGLHDSMGGEESPPTTIAMQVEIEHAGQKLDAFQLATDALQSWEAYI